MKKRLLCPRFLTDNGLLMPGPCTPSLSNVFEPVLKCSKPSFHRMRVNLFLPLVPQYCRVCLFPPHSPVPFPSLSLFLSSSHFPFTFVDRTCEDSSGLYVPQWPLALTGTVPASEWDRPILSLASHSQTLGDVLASVRLNFTGGRGVDYPYIGSGINSNISHIKRNR